SAGPSLPTFPRSMKRACRDSTCRFGTGCGHRKARPPPSSPRSTGRPSKLWPTRPCVGGSRNSASRLRRASSRRRKGCALFTGPRSRNGARSSRLPTSSRSEVRSRAALAPRWLWVVRRIGVVAEHSCDDGAADQRLQRTLQRIGFVLLVNFLAANIERKRLCVLRLFGRILDGLFRPLIKRITFSAVRLCISHVIRERIEL